MAVVGGSKIWDNSKSTAWSYLGTLTAKPNALRAIGAGISVPSYGLETSHLNVIMFNACCLFPRRENLKLTPLTKNFISWVARKWMGKLTSIQKAVHSCTKTSAWAGQTSALLLMPHVPCKVRPMWPISWTADCESVYFHPYPACFWLAVRAPICIVHERGKASRFGHVVAARSTYEICFKNSSG